MSKTFIFHLPWPDRKLSSNARLHWAVRAEATKAYRYGAMISAKAVGLNGGGHTEASLEFTFYPPDKRRRDIQNMPHMMKAAIDGIADAMGCDDNGFKFGWPRRFEAPIKGGKVAVLVHIGGEHHG